MSILDFHEIGRTVGRFDPDVCESRTAAERDLLPDANVLWSHAVAGDMVKPDEITADRLEKQTQLFAAG